MGGCHVLPELCPVGGDGAALAALEPEGSVRVDVVEFEPRQSGKDQVAEDAAVPPLGLGQMLGASVSRQLRLFGKLGVALVATVHRLIRMGLRDVLSKEYNKVVIK